MLKSVTAQIDFPKLEEEIIQFWKTNKIFEKSLEKDSPKGNWTFLDGPPFVTGLPHYGHLLTSIAKDLFPRFKTMQGYHVRRVWGWDGHGLPVENKVENKLEIKRKKDIEEVIGVKKFIDECKAYVTQISSEWEWYVDHVGRWVDFKNAYKTWDTPYMESVMWVFKQLYEKDLIYKGLKVSLYCPHCATPISNFEVAMDNDNYKEVTDPGTIYKFQLRDESKTYLLAWSTTPWTKISTSALAVNPKQTYVKVKVNNEKYILAEASINMLEAKYEILKKIKGKDLAHLEFVPHYDYYSVDKEKKAFIVVADDFVTAEEGTGIVTLAAYGEDDLRVMKEQNIHIELHLDEEGHVLSNVPKFGGMYYLKSDKAVNMDLAERGLIYQDKQYVHTMPHCWRCSTRLYYAPISAWYVNVQKLKEDMEKTNEDINWIPKHFKHGRFLKSLEHAPDWNISRNRYWGSPVPVWECECGERFIPGSIQELEKRSGRVVLDLHKPEIDEVTIECYSCKKTVHRVPEVLDSWIEAGSASFGERHFPFGKLRAGHLEVESLENFYPPDFIVEYTGQIRAWFYVLDVISNALYQKAAFKNVLVNGVILGTDGRKMSKNFKNYPDPKEMLQKYGGDALRLYLMSSPVVQGEDTSVSEEQYKSQVKGMLLLLWNVYNFFVSNAITDKYQVSSIKYQVSENVLDQWIVLLLENLVTDVTESLEKYDTVMAIGRIGVFVNALSTWHIRRSRDRVGPSVENGADKEAFYNTCHYVLTTLCKLMAPLTPFVTEEIYKNLTGEESVHLTKWPQINSKPKNQNSKLLVEMEYGMQLASKVHALRKIKGVKVRIPLKKLVYKGPEELQEEVKQVVLEEVNVYKLKYAGKSDDYGVSGDTSEKNQDIEAGWARDIIRQIQEERKKLGTRLDEMVVVVLPDWPEKFTGEIKRKALIKTLTKGDFSVQRV